MAYEWDIPSGNDYQFDIEHGPVEIVSFPSENCHFHSHLSLPPGKLKKKDRR